MIAEVEEDGQPSVVAPRQRRQSTRTLALEEAAEATPRSVARSTRRTAASPLATPSSTAATRRRSSRFTVA